MPAELRVFRTDAGNTREVPPPSPAPPAEQAPAQQAPAHKAPAHHAPAHHAPARQAGASLPRRLGGPAAALALMALLVPLHRWWAAQALLIPLLLIVPGVILLRALRIPGQAVSSFPVYVPCASVAVLFGSGLAVNVIGPLIGVTAPLRTVPLLAGLEVTCLALLAASAGAPPDVAIPWGSLARPARLAWPLAVPLLAAIGALRLNNGHGHGFAVLALLACGAMLVTATALSQSLSRALLCVILYAADLALMWGYSLRGSLVYGFDIATEYYDLHQTVLTGVWHAAHPGDAYGAMLSVTIMPAELHFLSGVSALAVFKVIYPAISALFPVGIFCIARRFLSRGWSFVAAGFFVAQASFAQELPAIARQEIALVLFAALFAAMLETRIARRPQWALVIVLSLTMVLAHYSTTYVAITLIGLMLPLQWAASWFREVPRITGAFAVGFVTALAGAVIWYGPVTHSAATGLTQLKQSVQSQGLSLLPNRLPGEGMITSYLQGNTPTPMTAGEYARVAHADYAANDLFVTPLPDAGLPQYALRDAAPPAPPVRWAAGYSALSLGSVLIQQLVNLLGAAGAILMLLRRKVSVITRQVGLLGLATVIFLILIRLSGTLAVTYNQERALLQSTAIMTITLCWLLHYLAGRRQPRQGAVITAAAASLAVMFIASSGLIGVVLGGPTATNLANSGEDFERFDMTAPELASAQWLGQAVPPGQLVYADRYAQLPLEAVTGITRGLLGDVTPLTLDQHAWVYASQPNVTGRRGRALLDDHTVVYVFPSGFLDANYDLVYTDGSSEVFHR